MTREWQFICPECPPLMHHSEPYDNLRGMLYGDKKRAEQAADWHDNKDHGGDKTAHVVNVNQQ